MSTDKITNTSSQLKKILNSFQKFKEKDAGIRGKAKDIFTQAKKRINERKLKSIKEKIKNI